MENIKRKKEIINRERERERERQKYKIKRD